MADKTNPGKNAQIGVRVTEGLKRKIEQRALETDYAGVSDYILGLIRYDLARRQPHTLTAPLSREPQHVQDDFERSIMSAYRQGGAVTGSALDVMVEQLFTDPVREEIASSFKTLIREKLAEAMAVQQKPGHRPKTRKAVKYKGGKE